MILALKVIFGIAFVLAFFKEFHKISPMNKVIMPVAMLGILLMI